MLDLAKSWSNAVPCDAHHLLSRAYRTARQLHPEDVDALETAHRSGAKIYELATRFGVSRATVSKHLRSRGIDPKPPGLHPDDVPEAARLYKSGWSLARIAEKFDCTANTVRARLLEVGTRMRDTQGRER